MHFSDSVTGQKKRTVKAKSTIKTAASQIQHESMLKLAMGQEKFISIYCQQERIFSKNFRTFFFEGKKKMSDALISKRYQVDKHGRYSLPFGYFYLEYLRVSACVIEQMLDAIEAKENYRAIE